MNRTLPIAALIFVVVILVLGGGYHAYENYREEQAEKAEALRLAAEEEARLEAQTLQNTIYLKQFERFLNSFLQAIAHEADEYKSSRRVLTSLMQPDNLRTPDYVVENYNLGETTVMSMRLQMDEIMGLFDQADAKFAELVEGWPERLKTQVADSWMGVKAQHTDLYLAYFESEQAVLKAIQNLLTFYFDNRDMMQVDVLQERINFADLELRQAHQALKDELAALAEMQDDLLGVTGDRVEQVTEEELGSDPGPNMDDVIAPGDMRPVIEPTLEPAP